MNGDLQDIEGVDIGKKHKLGHLRVDIQGNATFKHLPTSQLVQALQLGIQHSVGGLEARQAHDVLYQDFLTVEIIHFPKSGRTTPKPTPPHRFNDFTIRSYAPVAFRHFREKFYIKPEDYLSSICKPFRELKNPGASGSLFYLTSDDEFIIKTVQKKEAAFLKSLLPGYYMNVTQNKRTLLPKFFGLYCYQVTEFLPRNKHSTGDNKNIRITVMNNLIPSHVQMHEKYDLKGSTFKRRANNEERQKESPTWKDLDFIERHPEGLLLDAETYNALAKTIHRDCRVLESFHIMDYSFLIGVHLVDAVPESPGDSAGAIDISNPFSSQPKRMMYSTPMDNIQAEFDEHNKPDDHLARTGGIPARTAKGERLSLYVGIIDILQSYQLRKKLEHTFKSVVTDGSQISVTNPSFYSDRFQKFLFNNVFKKSPQRSSKVPSEFNSNPTPSQHTSIHVNPSQLNYTSSTASTVTNASHLTSMPSSRPSKSGSSTTVYASSHQSDSLYNEPKPKTPARIITTSYSTNQKNQSRLKFYHELSAKVNKTTDRQQSLPDTNQGKFTSSTNNLAYGTHSSQYPSTDEMTRL